MYNCTLNFSKVPKLHFENLERGNGVTVEECMLEDHAGLVEGITAVIMRYMIDKGDYKNVSDISKHMIYDVRHKVNEYLKIELEVTNDK